MWGKLPTGALASANRRKAQQKSLRKPSQAQKYTGGNVRKIYGALYAVALVERIAAFRAEFRRMRRIGGLPAALFAAAVSFKQLPAPETDSPLVYPLLLLKKKKKSNTDITLRQNKP